MFPIYWKHLQCTTIGFAYMKGDFWVRVYLVHLVLLVAVPVRSVTVCRVRTEPSSTCGVGCVRVAARTKCGSVAQCASACSAKGARKSAPLNVRYLCVVGPLACAHYDWKCQILPKHLRFCFILIMWYMIIDTTWQYNSVFGLKIEEISIQVNNLLYSREC